MPSFRKQPVVIEAWQFTPEAWQGMLPPWLADAITRGAVWGQGGTKPFLTIRTLEGDHRADTGDWIICGVKGELYPCKPEIFDLTYEPAD